MKKCPGYVWYWKLRRTRKRGREWVNKKKKVYKKKVTYGRRATKRQTYKREHPFYPSPKKNAKNAKKNHNTSYVLKKKIHSSRYVCATLDLNMSWGLARQKELNISKSTSRQSRWRITKFFRCPRIHTKMMPFESPPRLLYELAYEMPVRLLRVENTGFQMFSITCLRDVLADEGK